MILRRNYKVLKIAKPLRLLMYLPKRTSFINKYQNFLKTFFRNFKQVFEKDLAHKIVLSTMIEKKKRICLDHRDE